MYHWICDPSQCVYLQDDITLMAKIHNFRRTLKTRDPVTKIVQFWIEISPEEWDKLPDSSREILFLEDEKRVAFVKKD